jgi:hypothetical protein
MVTGTAVLRPFEGALHTAPCHGTLIAADPEGVGAKTIMSTACGAFALPGLSVPSRRCAAFSIVATLAAMVAGVSATRAAELQSSSSLGFYSPLKAVELERYRAQGLTLPGSGDMTVGVILWDEYRRARQPRDTIDATGAHSATISLAASVHAR